MNDGLTCLGGSNQPDTMKGIAEKAVPFFFAPTPSFLSESCPADGLNGFDNAAGAEAKDPAHLCRAQSLGKPVTEKE